MQKPTQHISILIVGAGPTGLMMACQLARFGVPFRIIEKNLCPTDKSKALAVQARTLEIYDQMGIVEAALQQGLRTNTVNLIVKGKSLQKVPLGEIGKGISPYPFMHILEQSKNERLLVDFLKQKGIKVEWGTEFISLVERDKFVKITTKNLENEEETIYADWVVAADGGRSPIRHALEMKFDGGTYDNLFYVADVKVDWDLPYEELNLYISENTFIAFFPMKGEKRFRMVGILPKQYQEEGKIDFEQLLTYISSIMETPATFSDVRWSSVYRVHHRVVDTFRKGRIFLAGDAAHVHSPAGGQGMNTGLQDAYNLAWKMALVTNKQASPSLLDTYNEERLPFAQRLVETTDRGFSAMTSDSSLIRFFRLNVFPLIAPQAFRFDMVKKFLFRTISQTAFHYRNMQLAQVGKDSELSEKATHFCGDRLPYFFVKTNSSNETISVYDLLKAPKFSVFIVGKEPAFFQEVKEKLLQQVPENLFQVIHLPQNTDNQPFFKALGVKDSAMMLVRPDVYIAYLTTHIKISHLTDYLEQFLCMKLEK
ncbi:MAG: FAD-dependent monooxygenase [Bacteroidia bacterium]